jgi:hypothetical protein
VLSVADLESLALLITHSKLIELPAGGCNAWLEHPMDVVNRIVASLNQLILK